MSFYERYVRLCEAKGIGPTSQALADQIGIVKSAVSKWAAGVTPKVQTVVAIADIFGVSTDYLLERTDDPTDFSRVTNSFMSDYVKLSDTDKAKMDGFLQGLLANDRYAKKNQHLA